MSVISLPNPYISGRVRGKNDYGLEWLSAQILGVFTRSPQICPFHGKEGNGNEKENEGMGGVRKRGV